MVQDLSGLLSIAGEQYKLSSLTAGASAFAQMAGSYLDYSALQTNAYALKAQASNIELQAQQRANMLREQFISSIGSYQFGAAQRGVSVGSGSVVQNIESSAGDLGKDIQKEKKVAQMRANALRGQAKIQKMQAKSGLVSSILSGVGSLAGAVGTYAVGSELAELGKVKGVSSIADAQKSINTTNAHKRAMSLMPKRG